MLRPLGDHVLIRATSKERNEEVSRGKVAAVGLGTIGPDGRSRGLAVKKGDEVLYRTADAVVIQDADGACYHAVREGGLVAVEEK